MNTGIKGGCVRPKRRPEMKGTGNKSRSKTGIVKPFTGVEKEGKAEIHDSDILS